MILLVFLVLLTPRICWAIQPNVLVVIADDLDWLTYNATPGLDDIANEGMVFNGIISTPVCGPGRAGILGGNFSHNNGIKGNLASHYNSAWYANMIGKTFADWCQGVGYHTSMVGKYANPFDHLDHTGWNTWIETIGRSDGEVGGEFWEDAMVDTAIADIYSHNDKPQLVWYSSTLPHGPLEPSDEYAGSLSGLILPQGPSFNEADVSDKKTEVATLPLLTPDDINLIQRRYRLRAEMMRSVVDGIGRLRTALSNRPLYIVFVSDNGYLQGQHRKSKGKGDPYEESIGVPMFVIGPGVPAMTSGQMVYGADIAPTVADLCGASHPEVDAHSIVPLFSNPNQPWRNRQYIDEGWTGVRSYARKLIQTANGIEVYHLDTDPYELQASNAPVPALQRYLTRLSTCVGNACWLIETE